MKTTLLIPTLNEIEGMKTIMPRIRREWVDEILVVDGGSTDGTVEYAEANDYTLFHQKRRGLRYAYIDALDQIHGDVVITFSPDGNSIPELIPPLVAKMKEGYDMVIVSRYAQGAHSEDDDWVTAFGNFFFTRLMNILYGSTYTDVLVMFRAWHKRVFMDLDLDKESSYAMEERLLHTIVGVEQLLSIRAAKRKLKCADIPGDEPPRLGGKRKLQVFRYGTSILLRTIYEKFTWA